MARRTDPETFIRAQVVLDEHDMSADGRFAVVVRRFVVRDRYRSHLWLVPLAGRGKPIQITTGPVRDTSPRLAPDGSAVAFRRSPAASPGRKHRGTTEDPQEEVAPPRFLVGPPPAGDDAPTARRITRIDWMWDEEGTLDRWSHLHVVDAR